MLSSEGNENGEKTTIGLISKKATLHMQHTFFVHFFATVLHDYKVKLPETSWLHILHVWWKCRTCSCSLCFHCRSFSPLVTDISHFLNAATNFSCCPSNKESRLCFSSLALALFHSFSHWASLACRLDVYMYFLFLCVPNCGHDN